MNRLIPLIALLILFSNCQSQTTTPEESTPSKQEKNSMKAPDFPKYVEWLNTRKSYNLDDFYGKVVLLDFWTYCCINCIHVLPDLKRLEQEFPELVVVGVHSAKFEGEQSTDNIREAILRYDIEHPVINDHEFEMWQQYGIKAWPSFALIAPDNSIIGIASGEGVYETMQPYIKQAIAEYKSIIKPERFEFELERYERPASVLSFPGKLAVDAENKRLFISDSNNDRILITDADGNILDYIGSGSSGNQDGTFEDAQLFHPQGMAWDGEKNILYIADTENHTIRKADFNSRSLSTILGTGKQAKRYLKQGKGTELALNSPWDLVLEGDELRIAMAGPHQLWTMNTQTYEAKVFAGSGRENIIDGPALDAELAQPSGIDRHGSTLYFADSEVSAIRKVEDGKVKTLIGEGLFDFGDVDGKWKNARLQHALGVQYYEGDLYVADTYNNKIKRISLADERIETLIGTGESGMQDGRASEASLNEPNDIVFLDGKAYITDTNNGLIRVYDPKNKTVSSLQLKQLGLLARPQAMPKFDALDDWGELSANHQASEFVFRIQLPEGMKLNADAPQYLRIQAEEEAVLEVEGEVKRDELVWKLPVQLGEGATRLKLDAAIYYCEKGQEARCFIHQAQGQIKLNIDRDGGDLLWEYEVK